jgi:hypothetical protein
MSLTKITGRIIEPGTITANSLAEGISLGGGGGVTIDEIIVTDENFANTEETQILASGGYLKLYGSGFEANANVYFSNTFALTTQVTANVISSNEVHLTIGATSTDQFYNLFLINENASIATKLAAFTSYIAGKTHGWAIAGSTIPNNVPVRTSTIDRIEFLTDTATALVRGPLSGVSSGRTSMISSGNDEDAWVGGGLDGPDNSSRVILTTVTRINYATDSSATVNKGPLSLGRYSAASVADNNYGWFVGGENGLFPAPTLLSTIDRVTFSSDTATASVRGPLSSTRSRLGNTANDVYGWLAGGFGVAPAPIKSIVDRITFASDTGTTSVRGPLEGGRYVMGSAGNDNFGWFAGGYTGLRVSSITRIIYASDTATGAIRNSLSDVRNALTGLSNGSDYAWFSGGRYSGSPGIQSTVDRLTFADDTSAVSIRGPLSSPRTSLTGSSGFA